MNAITEIKSTRDYSLFKPLPNNVNRDLSQSHKNKVKRSLEEKQLIVPILVNENMEIIDGQHRYEACVLLELPIYFYQIDGYGIKEVRLINSTNKIWGPEDHIRSRARDGDEMYEQIESFMDDYSYGASTAMGLLTRKSGFSEMRNDTLKLVDRDFRSARVIADKMKRVAEIVGSGFHESHFALGFCDFLAVDNLDFDAFIKRIRKSSTKIRSELAEGASRKGFKIAILRAYNYNLPEDKKRSYPDFGE